MKTLLIAFMATLAFAGSATASAGTVTELVTNAALDGFSAPQAMACVAVGFASSGSINGSCQTRKSYPCSGRGCQPVSYITRYVATFDAQANPLTVSVCSITRHHLPQADQTTYSAGFDATTCKAPVYDPTGTVVVIDGTPYFYVATDPVSGAELVNSNVAGYLATP